MNRLKGKVAVVTGAIQRHRRLHRGASGRRGRIGRRELRQQQIRRGTLSSSASLRRKGRRLPCKPTFQRLRTFSVSFAETKKAFGKLRHPRQQRGHLRVRAVGGDHRRAFPQTVQPQCACLLLDDARSRQAFRARGRQCRQYQFVAADQAPAMGSVYSGTKAAVNAIHEIARQGVGARKNSCQRDQPRHGRIGRDA